MFLFCLSQYPLSISAEWKYDEEQQDYIEFCSAESVFSAVAQFINDKYIDNLSRMPEEDQKQVDFKPAHYWHFGLQQMKKNGKGPVFEASTIEATRFQLELRKPSGNRSVLWLFFINDDSLMRCDCSISLLLGTTSRQLFEAASTPSSKASTTLASKAMKQTANSTVSAAQMLASNSGFNPMDALQVVHNNVECLPLFSHVFCSFFGMK